MVDNIKTDDKSFNNNQGFTLVELIVVIVILGILAAILVPALLGYIDKSKSMQCQISRNAFTKAAYSLYVEDYAGAGKVTDDESYDEFLKNRLGELFEGAESTGNTLEFRNVCDQGGIVTVHATNYGSRTFNVSVTCSLHDDGEAGESSPTVNSTPEEVQREAVVSAWGDGLSYNSGRATTKTVGTETFTLGKALASNKLSHVKEFAKDLGVDTDKNIVAISNASSYKVQKADKTNSFPLVEELSTEVGKEVSPSYTKIVTISADNKGNTVSKGDYRTVTQYLFYETKNAVNDTVEKLYGSRTVVLEYTENNNLGKFNVYDLEGNRIYDTSGLVGWIKNE